MRFRLLRRRAQHVSAVADAAPKNSVSAAHVHPFRGPRTAAQCLAAASCPTPEAANGLSEGHGAKLLNACSNCIIPGSFEAPPL